jgi:ABC-type thiamine transport system ATPase subunit
MAKYLLASAGGASLLYLIAGFLLPVQALPSLKITDKKLV